MSYLTFPQDSMPIKYIDRQCTDGFTSQILENAVFVSVLFTFYVKFPRKCTARENLLNN